MSDTQQTPAVAPVREPLPWWWPDARGWLSIAVFILVCIILQMIANDSKLLSNASFMQLVGNIAGAGGLGLILAFHFASSSGAAKANDRADRAQARADAATGTPPGPVSPP